jgi:hypothetical protein
MTVNVDLAGLLGLEDFLVAAPDITRRSVSYAMNSVIGGTGLARYRAAIGEQVNLSPSYIKDRMGVEKPASPDSLVTTIVARQRPTSLARFASGAVVGGKGGVAVSVSRGGGSKLLKGGFLVNLRQGDRADGNVGLAVRLKPGQKLNKKDQSRMVHLEANVVLLYGPSIDQVLNNSVADAETPEILDATATEFYRQFARLSADAR